MTGTLVGDLSNVYITRVHFCERDSFIPFCKLLCFDKRCAIHGCNLKFTIYNS